jgi:putative inorganic carbon (hco3(-)) transporter
MILNIVVIVLTLSRGVFLGLTAAIIFYLFAQKKYRSIIIFSISLVLFISLCSYLPSSFNRLGKSQIMAENRGIFSNYRFNRWEMTQRIIGEHPLAGLGFQHFRIRFYEYFTVSRTVPYEFMIADNMYLTILAETGLIGAAGFFIFIFALFKRWLKKIREVDAEKKIVALIPILTLVALLVNMGAYDLFYWLNPYMLFCLFCGFICAS